MEKITLKRIILLKLCNFICAILPYYFIRWQWYRRFIYHYTSELLIPIDIHNLHEQLEDYSGGEIDMYKYYEVTHLMDYEQYKKEYLGE